MTTKSCIHQYCPGDHCIEKEGLRACLHLDCPANRCLRSTPEALALKLSDLGLPLRTFSALERGGIRELADLLACTPKDLLMINNLGIGSVLAIIRALKQRGLKFRPCSRSDLNYSGLGLRDIDIIVRETNPHGEVRE